MRTDLVRVLSGQRPLAPMVMTDEDRTTILAAGRNSQPQQRGRHRPAAMSDEFDDYDPYEDEEEERRRRRRKGWLIALLSILGVALIGVLIWLMSSVLGDQPGGNQVSVPDVIGKTEESAKADITQSGLNFRIQDVFCQPTPNSQPGQCGPDNIGKVIDTNPKPNEKIDKGQNVTLSVGREAKKITVPDLTGKTPDEAKAAMPDGLTINPAFLEEEVDDEAQIGKIIAQDPAPDTPVAPGSQVKITVGKAKATTSVPDLTGQDFDTAKSNLESLGFRVKREDQSSDKPANQVIDQNPKGGQHPKDTEITLVVSKGDQTNQKITVPDLTGMRPGEARNLLRGMGWTGDFNETTSPTTDANEIGKILEQEIAPNSQINKDQSFGIGVGQFGGGR
jgi:serine/threonine-protein kinase